MAVYLVLLSLSHCFLVIFLAFLKKTEVILAFALQILEHGCYLLLDLLVLLLDLVIIIAVYPEEKFVLHMLVKELDSDLVLASQSQHHYYLLLGECVLVLDELLAAPLVKVIVEGSDLLLHQVDALEKVIERLLGRQGLQLCNCHFVPVLRSERPFNHAMCLLAEPAASLSEK